MKIRIYNFETDFDESLRNVQDAYYSSSMQYLASDLLEKGLAPSEITDALQRAMAAAKASRIELRRHFYPIYTHYRGSMVRDCKLSKLGYALVLLNSNPKKSVVANWQLEVLKRYFEK